MREQRSNSDKDLTERGKESVKLDQERTDSRDHAKQSGKDEAEKEAVTSTANQQKK